ncbi:hypothetical protein [Reichenbachiella ulvae]|uniref:Prepilin-type N-terminal cleavage/methylation domain-containing protein n=1 Tax=Reichenbachiella ulvae TaxID=2980104 RepID=A0ABT3CUT6_9BACT|nr:hypothetical protein [Reichenbachiella ulvae]MCV9387460.1 hypothetical protein [Reichenbachiella ulvae]
MSKERKGLAILKRWRAYTLMESLVAGIIISMVTGLAMLIYLNVSASMSNTRDMILESRAYQAKDSLRHLIGEQEMILPLGEGYDMMFTKKSWEGDTDLYQLEIEVLDTLGVVHLQLYEWVYE